MPLKNKLKKQIKISPNARTLPLSLKEARQMSMEDVILVTTVRGEIRGGTLRVDAADIPRHIEVRRLETLFVL